MRLARIALFVCSCFLANSLFAQTYITNGSAVQNTCNCYTLTQATMNQSGSVWNATKMNLNQPFDFKFNVFLGCGDFHGADGIAFILQTSARSVGRTGSGLGFAGVSPSIGIALDTYQNTVIGDVNDDLNDPSFDHISIQANGVVRHGSDLANPVPASATSDNIEDCNWHVLRITWEPATKQLAAYFDGVFRVGATVDLINTIFGSNASVYWGFSASTGGEVNVQQFCTALNPVFNTNLANDGTCIGNPVTITDSSFSFAPITDYFWDFGDGSTTTNAQPAAHLYAKPGVYPVKLAITGLDGCKSDTLRKLVTIGSIPEAGFTITDGCFGQPPAISFAAENFGTSYQWLENGALLSTDAVPAFTQLLPGTHNLLRRVISDFGCGSDEASRPLNIKPAPDIKADGPRDVCINTSAQFHATQQDNQTNIQQWHWTFDDGTFPTAQNPMRVFRKAGLVNSLVWATASNGCSSDTIQLPTTVYQSFAYAGTDTMVLNNVPFQLNGSGDGTIRWLPATGLDRDDILKPTGTVSKDQWYELTVTNGPGCTARDSIFVEVFKGSSIYVPTAFSPDGDGRNDFLKPQYNGIKKLSYFTIYNRWGQRIFSTTNLSQAWDGTQATKTLGTGTYVWMLQAEDLAGKVYHLKGTVVLVR